MVTSKNRARRWTLPLALLLACAATPAAAQGFAETPGAALSRHIRVLAASPRDFNALIGAGRAALELGDVQAAAGFFGRAEEVNANAPAAKAGLGAAMAHMGDADGANFYFNQASRLGAPPLTIALDRGLARDLNGDLGAAQSDYRLAIQSLNSDEGRRRLALSLAIGRDQKAAMDSIQPLLNRRDPGAQRIRAFVLALTGDRAAASQAIEAVMPGASSRFDPFFRLLPMLTVAEKAAAVHLGLFPEDAATRTAQAVTQPVPSPPVRIAQALPPPVTAPSVATQPPAPPPEQSPVKVAVRDTAVSTDLAAASPGFSLPSATVAPPAALPTPVATPGFAEEEPVAAGDIGLAGIDTLLATIDEAAPPPPQPKVEVPAGPDAAALARLARAEKAAAARKAADKKKRDDKLAAERKAREEAARLGVVGTHWIQLAGGSNADRMGLEYRRLSAKAGSLLKSRPGYVTSGKDYFRLLIGPFDDKGEAQALVNKLAKEGVDGFSWTRTPAQIKIEKLAAR